MTVYRASVALSRYQVASVTADGLVVADPSSAALEGVVVGLVSAGVIPGRQVDVIDRGVVTNPAWSWSSAGVAIYVGASGALTETAPGGWSRVIAYAVSPTSILVVPAAGSGGGGGGGGLPPDGDYGDVAVSGSGTTWAVEASATAALSVFTSIAKGLAPASGGGTTNFLRADGTWTAPAGGGGSPNLDGGTASSVYGGIDPIDGGSA